MSIIGDIHEEWAEEAKHKYNLAMEQKEKMIEDIKKANHHFEKELYSAKAYIATLETQLANAHNQVLDLKSAEQERIGNDGFQFDANSTYPKKELTPMQELIEYTDYLINEWGVDGDAKQYVLDIKTKAQSLIPKEKQMVIDAYSAAGHEYYNKSFNETTSVEYFKKKYNENT